MSALRAGLLTRMAGVALLLSAVALLGARGGAASDVISPNLLQDLLADGGVKVEEIVCVALPQNSSGHAYETFGYRAGLAKQHPTAVSELVGGVEGARLLRLNLRTRKVQILLEDAQGAIRDPCVHYDGQRLLFSYRKTGAMCYHLYEIQSDGTGLKQLTDGDYDDVEPCYLPDGGIVFVSSRSQRWVPCFCTQVGTLFRCDSDGGNILRLSANVDHDLTPWVFPDGRVVFTRWEYVDRHEEGDWSPWAMRPDGCGLVSFFGYGTRKGGFGAYIDVKPVPGTSLAVAIESNKNVTKRNGRAVLLDTSFGPQDREAVLRTLRGATGSWRDPWALSARWFLLVGDDGLWLLDEQQGRRQLLLATQDIPGAPFGSWKSRPPLVRQARAVAARPREPASSRATDWSQSSGRLYMADFYRGRAASLNGLRRGDVKKIMVYEMLPDPVHHEGPPGQISVSSAWNIKRLLGTFPVEEDGSAYVEVPALRALQFVALDIEGLGIKRMHAFTSVMPGETQSCIGCHEQRDGAIAPGVEGQALRRPPSRLDREGLPDIVDYPRHIQPIWDRNCVKCHNPDEMKGQLDLSGHRGTYWSHSAFHLIAGGYVRSTGARGGANPPPRSIGSPASPLLNKLRGQHHEARLTDAEYLLVVRWIDAGTPYAGTYACSGTGGTKVNLPEDIFKARCLGCHANGRGYRFGKERQKYGGPARREDFSWDNILFDLTEPAKSLVLRAPLAKEAGGLGWCRAADGTAAGVFASKDDPDYRRTLALIQQARAGLNSFEVPGFTPHYSYFREMIRYGILPAAFDSRRDAYDVYDLDRRYYEQQYPPFPMRTP